MKQYTKIQDLSAAIKSLRAKGFDVIKTNMKINSRQAYDVWTNDKHLHGRTVTDYELLDIANYEML